MPPKSQGEAKSAKSVHDLAHDLRRTAEFLSAIASALPEDGSSQLSSEQASLHRKLGPIVAEIAATRALFLEAELAFVAGLLADRHAKEPRDAWFKKAASALRFTVRALAPTAEEMQLLEELLRDQLADRRSRGVVAAIDTALHKVFDTAATRMQGKTREHLRGMPEGAEIFGVVVGLGSLPEASPAELRDALGKRGLRPSSTLHFRSKSNLILLGMLGPPVVFPHRTRKTRKTARKQPRRSTPS